MKANSVQVGSLDWQALQQLPVDDLRPDDGGPKCPGMLHSEIKVTFGGYMGFIGYLVQEANGNDPSVRIFLECRDLDSAPKRGTKNPSNQAGISYTYAVDVVFPKGRPPCRLHGVKDVLSLKKFYKVISSLEERAREHGNPRQAPLESIRGFVEHLRYTRNARDLREASKLSRRPSADAERDWGCVAS